MDVDKKVLGSLLEKFCLPVLTFPPLKMEKWFEWLQTVLVPVRIELCGDPVSWEAVSGHRINILLLAIELKDFCSNIKAFWNHIWDFIFFSDSSAGDTSANKSCP